MNCETIREMTSGLIDGELDRDTAAKVRDHLRSCSACAGHVETLTAFRALFASAARESVAQDDVAARLDDVWERIAAEAAEAPPAPRLPSAPTIHAFRRVAVRRAALAAAAIIVLALPGYFGVLRVIAPAPFADAERRPAPAGLALAKYVQEIESGMDEAREFLALHDGREVDMSELARQVDFEPCVPTCAPDGLTLDKCYVLRTADGAAIGCAYRSGSRRMMVFQQRAGEPILCDGLSEVCTDVCGMPCRSMATGGAGGLTVLNWEGSGRTTTVVCSKADAEKLGAIVNALLNDDEPGPRGGPSLESKGDS